VIADQVFREGDDILCLGVEQANGLDGVPQPFLAERDHLFGRFHALEQWLGRNIYACVSCLRRQHDSDQQGIGIVIFELGRRRGVLFG